MWRHGQNDAPGEVLAGAGPVVRGEREIGGGASIAPSDRPAVAWVGGCADVNHETLVVVVADAKAVTKLVDICEEPRQPQGTHNLSAPSSPLPLL